MKPEGKVLKHKVSPPQSMPNSVNIPIRLIIFGDDDEIFLRMGIKKKNRVGPRIQPNETYLITFNFIFLAVLAPLTFYCTGSGV